jgi:hypothetical protein
MSRQYTRWLTDYVGLKHITYASKKIKDRKNEKEETNGRREKEIMRCEVYRILVILWRICSRYHKSYN